MRRLLLLLLSSPFLFSLTHSFHHRSIHFPSQAAKEVLSTYTKKKSNNGSREEGCECFLFPSSFRSAIEEADRWGDACRGLVGPNQPFRAASLLAATPGGLGRSRSRMQRDIEQGDGNSESQTRDGFLSARPPKKHEKRKNPTPLSFPLFPSLSHPRRLPPSKRNETKPNHLFLYNRKSPRRTSTPGWRSSSSPASTPWASRPRSSASAAARASS